jgi:hypothetical protein
MYNIPRSALRVNGMLRIVLAVAALQLVAALPAASHNARPVTYGTEHAPGDGLSAVVKRAPVSQARGRRSSRRRADTLLPGMWGGEHARLEVTESGASVEFDCAHATVGGRIVVDRTGRFSVAGTFYAEHGGPVRSDETSSGFPVRLTGRVGGSLLKLNVTRVRPREVIGTFALARDREAELFKCR